MIREKIELFRRFIQLEFADKDIVKVDVIISPDIDTALRRCVLCRKFLGDSEPIVRVTAVRKDYWDLRYRLKAWDRDYRRIDARKLFTHTYYFHLKCFIMGFGRQFYDELRDELRKHFRNEDLVMRRFYVWSRRYE